MLARKESMELNNISGARKSWEGVLYSIHIVYSVITGSAACGCSHCLV